MGLRISFSALAGQQDRPQGLLSLLFGDPNQTTLCTESSGQMVPSVLLCRQGDPQAVLSVQLPVLWLDFLVRGTESCFIQQWEGLRISIPA